MLTRIRCHVSGPDDKKKEEDSYAKGNIRKVLKLLLIKRPTIEELERKGIIKGILQLCLLHVQKFSFRKLPSLLCGQFGWVFFFFSIFQVNLVRIDDIRNFC